MTERRPHPVLLALVALAALQVVLALVWVRPGPLSIDEVLYQWMARSAAEGHPLTVANGYGELPSPELATVDYMRTAGGRLTVQYPLLFPLLAAPLYAWAGLLGVFLLNALAFAGVLVLTWRIGIRLLEDARAALAGVAILALGTFAWAYAMAAWPHMAALLLELAAFEWMLAALDAGRTDASEIQAARAAAVAGLLLGIAVGLRRDAVFFLPVVALPLLFASPPRARTLSALAAGVLPPLALLGWLNWLRWGSWSPLSYGRVEPQGFRVLVLVGALGLVGITALALPPLRRRATAALIARPQGAALAAAVLALLLFALPQTAPRMLRMLDGVESLLFDLRGSATEVAGGQLFYFAVLYAGGLKKSLLQSLPWLPLLFVSAALAWHDPPRRRPYALLRFPAAVYIGVHVFLNRHGAMSLNLRYYLPALPFLSLLGADALRVAWRTAGAAADGPPGRARALALATPAAAALALWLVLRPDGFTQPRDAVAAALDALLVLAGLCVLAAIAWVWKPVPGPGRPASLAVLATASAALAWSACLAFDYDARWSRTVRAANLARSVEVAVNVAPHSLLFGQWPDWHGTVPAFVPDVIVAYPGVDDYRDFRRLALRHLDIGRRIYLALDAPTLNLLEEREQLA